MLNKISIYAELKVRDTFRGQKPMRKHKSMKEANTEAKSYPKDIHRDRLVKEIIHYLN